MPVAEAGRVIDIRKLQKRADATTSDLSRIIDPRDLRVMNFGVLTAAIQEPGMKKKNFFDDPIEAAMQATLTWINIARHLARGAGLSKFHLQLASAFPAPDDPMDQTKMLDAVAAHLAVRSPRSGPGVDLRDDYADHIKKACGHDVKIANLGAFINLMAADPQERRQAHEHTLRVARAAQKLECTSITGFIGRNPSLNDAENMVMFEQEVVPLLKKLHDMGIVFHVENCPMPGWDKMDHYIKNIACTPDHWMGMYRICEKHGIGETFRITYDESHLILMGSNRELAWSALRAAGLEFLVDEFHSKDQFRSLAKIAASTGLGRTSPFLGDLNMPGATWGRMTSGPTHPMPGVSGHDPAAMTTERRERADWFGHQLDARRILRLDPRKALCILEHEFGDLRVQDVGLVTELLQLSLWYMLNTDRAAAAKYQSWAYLRRNKVAVPGGTGPALWRRKDFQAEVWQFTYPLPKDEY